MNIPEERAVLFFDGGNRAISAYKISSGSSTSTMMDTQIVLSTAIKFFATGIIIGILTRQEN